MNILLYVAMGTALLLLVIFWVGGRPPQTPTKKTTGGLPPDITESALYKLVSEASWPDEPENEAGRELREFCEAVVPPKDEE
jgi:hypothetical protein